VATFNGLVWIDPSGTLSQVIQPRNSALRKNKKFSEESSGFALMNEALQREIIEADLFL